MIFVFIWIAVIISYLILKNQNGNGSNGGTLRDPELGRDPDIALRARWDIYDPNKEAINSASAKYNVPVWVIVGTIKVESNGNNNARGSAGEVGLMQLYHQGAILDWRKTFGFVYSDEFFEVAKNNIQVGTWFLSKIHSVTTANWVDTILHVYQVGVAGYRRGTRSPDYGARFKRLSEAILIYIKNGKYEVL